MMFDIKEDATKKIKKKKNKESAEFATYIYHTGAAFLRGLHKHRQRLKEDILKSNIRIETLDSALERLDIYLDKILSDLYFAINKFHSDHRLDRKDPVLITDTIDLIDFIESIENKYTREVNSFIRNFKENLIEIYKNDPFILKTACLFLDRGYRDFINLVYDDWYDIHLAKANIYSVYNDSLVALKTTAFIDYINYSFLQDQQLTNLFTFIITKRHRLYLTVAFED